MAWGRREERGCRRRRHGTATCPCPPLAAGATNTSPSLRPRACRLLPGPLAHRGTGCGAVSHARRHWLPGAPRPPPLPLPQQGRASVSLTGGCCLLNSRIANSFQPQLSALRCRWLRWRSSPAAAACCSSVAGGGCKTGRWVGAAATGLPTFTRSLQWPGAACRTRSQDPLRCHAVPPPAHALASPAHSSAAALCFPPRLQGFNAMLDRALARSPHRSFLMWAWLWARQKGADAAALHAQEYLPRLLLLAGRLLGAAVTCCSSGRCSLSPLPSFPPGAAAATQRATAACWTSRCP